MLCASELKWSGVEGEYQRAINRMARPTLGAFRSTPQGIIVAESGLTPARPLLEHRQARFAHRLYARPQGGGGPEEILTREGAAVTIRLRAAVGMRRGETVEPQQWSTGRAFPGAKVIDEKDTTLYIARNWDAPKGGAVGAACVWREGETWSGHRFFLGNNKEVFDAEAFATYQALRSFEERQESGHHYAVFTDAQAAVRRMATDAAGPGQCWARAAIEVCSQLRARDNIVQVRWVPAHIGIEGNEAADTFTNEAAGGRQYSVEDRQLQEASLSHLSPGWLRSVAAGPQPGGSLSMYGQSEGTGPRQGPNYEGRHCAEYASPWPAGTTSYYPDMQRSDPFFTKG